MQLTKYETIMLYVMAITDLLKRAFLKAYPIIAIGYSTIYTFGFIGYTQRHIVIKMSDYQNAVVTAVVLTILTLFYLVLTLREKLRGD